MKFVVPNVAATAAALLCIVFLVLIGWINLSPNGCQWFVGCGGGKMAMRASEIPVPPTPAAAAAASLPPIPTIEIGVDIFNHPVKMPLVGAGTWQYHDKIAYSSVCQAFSAGYTMVDTAFAYKNQVGVGRALQDCFFANKNNKNRTRQDLFVLTKVPGGLTAAETWAAHNTNLRQLQLDYVDHLMVHFPADWSASPDRATPERRQEQWRAMQEIYQSFGARSIGISHYCPQHIDDVLAVSDIVTPSLNQVEYHIGSGDLDHVIAKCRKHNITFMSFSPLCGPCEYEPKDSLISGTLVTEIAKKYNVTGSQVSLRFIVQQALTPAAAAAAAAAAASDKPSWSAGGQGGSRFMGGVIPKSNNLQHMLTNRDIFSFELSDEDMFRLHAATKPPAEGGDCQVP